jgi:F-type H+-transporting ATPase subunit a
LNIISIPSVINLSISNIITTFLTLFLFSFIYYQILIKNKIKLFSPRWQTVLEGLILTINTLLADNITYRYKSRFLPITGSIFFFILFLNIFGLLPFTFTVTSQLIITFTISLSAFIGIQILCAKYHKIKFFSLFFPAGVPLALSFLLVPIELISFIFKPISLAIRLFANMTAGHTLLKVIAGFVWTIVGIEGLFSFFHLFPLAILFGLYFLETGVAIIQAFVFVILICSYINEAINIH